MKNNLLLYILIIVLLAALLLVSCTPKDPYLDDDEDDTPLQVYLIYFDSYEKSAINKYNKETEFSKIYNRKIEITEFEYEEIENMYDRISSEIMAGKGPDIIFISGITDYYLDLAKMAEQDAFADMDVLIEKSEAFSFEKYNKPALDAGIIGGKRVMMPLSYKVNYIATTQENLDKINMSVPDYLTYEIFFDMVEKAQNETSSVGALYNSRQLLYNMISKDGLAEEGTDELKKFMELEMEDDKRFELLGYSSGMIEDLYQYVCNGDVLMNYSGNTGGGGEFEILGKINSIVENLYNKDFMIMNEPTMNADISYGYIDRGCVINMNSKHKSDAFKFVEYLLSESCQYSFTLSTDAIPVNIASYENAKKDFIKDSYAVLAPMEDYGYALTPISEEIKNYYIALVEGVTEYKYIGQERYIYKHVISDTIRDYKDGKIDFDTMIEEINRQLKIYYSE